MQKKSIEFLIITLSIFITGGVIFGSVAYGSLLFPSSILYLLGAGVRGGYFTSSIFCGFYLLVKFISNKSMFLKAFLALVFPLTVAFSVVCGLFMIIPCVVICIIRIIRTL